MKIKQTIKRLIKLIRTKEKMLMKVNVLKIKLSLLLGELEE